MSYSEKLAERVRQALGAEPGLSERKMFGGVGFMVHGNMCCGVLRDDLIVRVGADSYDRTLTLAHARPMDRPMRGFVQVTAEGTRTSRQLTSWVGKGLEFARALPPKS